MPPIRVAVIGCGFFAPNHLNAWNELDAAELVAVCDLDEGKARAAAARFAVPDQFADAAQMIDATRPDLVDIVTTMESHRTLVELCAARGIPVVVQKPFGPTIDDCEAMVGACRKAGVMLMVHENFRFQHPMRRVKAVLDAGAIGTPVWARISFRSHYDVKAGQPYLFTVEKFIVLDLGIHLLDLARFFLGEAVSVYSRHQRIDPRVRGEDMATMILEHANGATSVVDLTYESRQLPDPFPQTLIKIEGSKGALRLERGFRLSVSNGEGLQSEDVTPPPRSWTSEPWHVAQDSVYHTQAHALAALAGGFEPETSGADNLKTYALVDAAYRSAETVARVAL